MREPRTLGSAHAGTVEWMLQRVTAVYLGLFAVYLALCLALYPSWTYAAWRAFWSDTPIRLAALLFCLSLLLHAWIGLRSVLRDYIKSGAARFVLELMVATGLAVEALWSFHILWG